MCEGAGWPRSVYLVLFWAEKSVRMELMKAASFFTNTLRMTSITESSSGSVSKPGGGRIGGSSPFSGSSGTVSRGISVGTEGLRKATYHATSLLSSSG